jgi:hypothetical protein
MTHITLNALSSIFIPSAGPVDKDDIQKNSTPHENAEVTHPYYQKMSHVLREQRLVSHYMMLLHFRLAVHKLEHEIKHDLKEVGIKNIKSKDISVRIHPEAGARLFIKNEPSLEHQPVLIRRLNNIFLRAIEDEALHSKTLKVPQDFMAIKAIPATAATVAKPDENSLQNAPVAPPAAG